MNKKVNKIFLDTRLNRLSEGCASDPDYNVSVIRSWANTPIRVYMAGFEEAFNRLGKLLALTADEKRTMTYQETARRIGRIADRKTVCELLELLVEPIMEDYRVRMRDGGNVR